MPRLALFLGLLTALAAAGLPAAPARAAPGDRTVLGRPGYLVIADARDTTGNVFSIRGGPGPGRRALVWPEGTLSLPDSVGLDPVGGTDLGLVCAPALSGVGSSGQLVFRDGIFTVSEPLVLADGVFELHVAAGRIEIRGERLVYRRPPGAGRNERNLRADMIMLAGVVVLVVVLMRRARRLGARR